MHRPSNIVYIHTMRSGDTRRCNFVIESRALLLFEPMDDDGVGGVGISI